MAPAALEDDADPNLTHFAHKQDFFDALTRFLSIDLAVEPTPAQDVEEEGLVQAMGGILDQYLPLPGLLDPHLDQIVPPLMDVLVMYLTRLSQSNSRSNACVSPPRLYRLGKVINWTVKVRGWKAIIPQFPSAISHLPVLISVLSPHGSPTAASDGYISHHPLLVDQEAWELRAILLLWLAMLLTAPFSLSALGDPDPLPTSAFAVDMSEMSRLFSVPLSRTAERCVLIAIPLLRSSGKEGAYAGLVLARIYSRTDASAGLPGFLDWLGTELAEGEREGEANFVASVLAMMAVLPGLVAPASLDALRDFMEDTLVPHLRGGRTAATSGLIRKLAIKARGRWWIAKLGHHVGDVQDPPDGLEEALDDFMTGLGDRDTIVRYSSAKYLARIAVTLPPDFASQIVLATISLLQGTEAEPVVLSSYGTVVDPGGTSSSGGAMGLGGDDAARGEARWHGVCLAVAEMARRGLVQDEAIDEAVQWAIKGLTFDLRRGSHSIGSNVRDAATYVLWSLSRACNPEALAAHAHDMATAMVCVACFDREVGVRRAASAAFQEGVGRLGLYPEGIDVLGKTDFYSVSVRRLAFSVAAPAVGQHEVYRSKMREHLHNITLRHWDTAMRVLGAAALRDLLALSGGERQYESIQREIEQLPSLDSTNVHGALSALGQISSMLKPNDEAGIEIFRALSSIRPAALISSISADILQSACDLLVSILDEDVLRVVEAEKTINLFIDMSMKRKEEACHEAVARLFGRLSQLGNGAEDVKRLISSLKSLRAPQRQSAALALGALDYSRCPPSLPTAIRALLAQLDTTSKADVETRRNAIRSLSQLAIQVNDRRLPLIAIADLQDVVSSCIAAMGDYTTDQRGDVGSWIRKAALCALGEMVAQLAVSNTDDTEDKLSRLPQQTLDRVLAGMYKLAVEKLEPVRGAAALALGTMRSAKVDTIWEWAEAGQLVVDLPDGLDSFRRSDQADWFASAMPLLATKWRPYLVAGLCLTIGSQMGSVSDLVFAPFEQYILAASEQSSLLVDILKDIHSVMQAEAQSNRVCIPALQTLNRMCGSPLWSSVKSQDLGSPMLDLVNVAARNLAQLKTIDRITGAMKLIVNLLSASNSSQAVRTACINVVPVLLGHRFPRVRTLTAEQLYLAVEGMERTDDNETSAEELEELLLESEWAQAEEATASENQGRVQAVVALIRAVVVI